MLSGWSAGGHLTASALDMPEVDAGLKSIYTRIITGFGAGLAPIL